MEMLMMIPMKSSLMMVTMATISPLSEGISPADCSLPESFSLSRVSAPWRQWNFSWMVLPVLGFSGKEVREGSPAEVGQGNHTTWQRAGRRARATTWCGPVEPHLGLPFWLPSSSG